MNIIELREEVNNILLAVGTPIDGETLWEPYQKIIAFLTRLNQIHNDLAWLEIMNQSTMEQKKFRTMIVDKTIEALERAAAFESRKLTAKKMEWEMDKQ